MRTKPPAFQFYPSDFLVGTMHMTCEQRGAYIVLLCLQWEHGQLPDDLPACAQMAGIAAEKMAPVWLKFGCPSAGIRLNARLEKIRANMDAFRDRQAEKGRARHKNSREPAGRQPELSRMPAETPFSAETQPEASRKPATLAEIRHQPEASSPISDLQSSIVPLSSPKGDRVSEPASLPAAASAEKKEGGGGDKSDRSGKAERLRLIGVADEMGRRICALFTRQGEPSSVMQASLYEHAQRGIIPLEPKRWLSIVRMHAERKKCTGQPEDFALRVGWLTNAEALAARIGEAGDAAMLWVSTHFGPDARTAAKKEAPENWRTLAVEMFGEPVPAHWQELPAHAQRAILEKGAA